MKMFVMALAALCAAAAAGAAAQGTAFDRVWADLQREFKAGVADAGVVGASMMVVDAHGIRAHAFTGTADLASRAPVTDQTIYHWASNTKTLTGIAIMQLRDRGLLSLEDPIVKYLPELRQVHNPFGPMDRITLRHLLTHAAGFRAATWPWGGEPWNPHEPLHWSQLAAMLPYTEILFEPGSRFSYSNPGVVFLGRVIELLTTDDYEVYVDKNILKPLEMYRSYFDVTPYHLLPVKSRSYVRARDARLTPQRVETNTGITVSNGGLNAPLADMAKYVRFLIGDRATADRDAVVLKRTSLEEMFAPTVPIGGDSFMGLTFFIDQVAGRRVIGHTGGQNGFVTRMQFDPAARVGLLLAFNTIVVPPDDDSGSPTAAVSARMRDRVFGNLVPLMADTAGARGR